MPAARPPRVLDAALLDGATAAARASARGRRNVNLHADDGERCHRLLNAIEPGSYVAPHRHVDPAKDEAIVAVRGRLGCVLFDDDGTVVAAMALAPGGERFGIDVPHGAFHAVFALEPGTVFFEAKAGPYLPLAPAERAPWAPAEGEPGAAEFLAGLVERARRAG